MWDFSLLTAMQSVERSMGFLLHRWLIFFGVATGFLVATLAGAGTAIGIGSLTSDPLLFGHSGAFAGFIAFSVLCYRARQTIYCAVVAPHLFLLAMLAKGGGKIPEGWAQVEFARRGMAERAPNSKLVWQIRQTTADTLGRLPHLFTEAAVSSTTSVYGGLAAKVRSWLYASNVDLIIADIVHGSGSNAWLQARAGVLLQAKNRSLLLKNRRALVGFEGVVCVLAYLLWLLAFQKIAAALPFSTGGWPYVFALLFAWNIKASFLEPIADAALMQLALQEPEDVEAGDLAKTLAAESEPFRVIESAGAGGVNA